MDRSKVVVRKPWGREYLCYRNDYVDIWALHMLRRSSTSLHAHPGKNTALIVLRGDVEIRFIRGSPVKLHGLDKINIFRGRFHQIVANTDAILFEVETSRDKNDLVRLLDVYGRGQGYEGSDAEEPIDEDCFKLPKGLSKFADCNLHQGALHLVQELHPDAIVAFLSGGLAHGLMPPGDVIDALSLRTIAEKFPVLPGTEVLVLMHAVP